MNPTSSLHAAWQSTLDMVDPPTRAQVAATIDRAAPALADVFYETMLADPTSARLLDHGLVNTRLRAAMADWLRQLFVHQASLQDCIDRQKLTGAVHARVGVPIELVTVGARVLKRRIALELTAGSLPRPALAVAVQYAYELMDLAIDAMNAAYSSDASRLARADEAYRLQFLTQNMKAERERQKSELLEWAHQILTRHYWSTPDEPAAPALHDLGASPFVLWLRHKASMLFDGAPEIGLIEGHIQAIEQELLPRLGQLRADREQARHVVASITSHVDQVKQLLGTMFDRFVAVEDGRDEASRVLNRRYFPSVVKREIGLAQQHKRSFALLAVAVDALAPLQEAVGPDVSHRMVLQLAEAIVDHLRAGDFVFRLADDQFLVLLVEADTSAAATVAEGLRACAQDMPLRGPGAAVSRLTVSVGVAVFDGHPDFQHLLDGAHQAQVKARRQGGNQVVAAA